MILALMFMFTVNVSCSAVDPIANTITTGGVTSRYADTGEGINYAAKQPTYAQELVTERVGTGVRVGCGVS